jgi:hypothetical protein
MKKITNLLIIKSLLLVLFLSFTNASAMDETDVNTPKAVITKSYSVAVKHLTTELQTAFNDKTVSFKLTNLRQDKLNQKAFQVEGEGLAIFKSQKENLPLHFSFSTDANGLKVSNLNYEFLEADVASADVKSNDAPDKVESTLMREIMKQIHNDYKTTNIVIAIDDFQKIDSQNNVYEGSGEVRVGDMIWKQIDFKVKLDEKNENAKDVNYKSEK